MPIQNTQNTSEQSAYCRSCDGIGIIGWKTPDNYPISDVTFCECVVGQRRLESIKAEAQKVHQKKLDSSFASAGIPPHFRDMTIETMIARCGKGSGKLDAINAVKSYIENGYLQDTGSKRYKSGIVLAGEFGRGKTGLLTPVLRHMLEKGKSGLWIETYDFISEIQSGYENGSSLARLEAAERADFVLLDDFGDKSRERAETDDRRRIIYQLVNYRHNYGLPMLITTNLTGAEMSIQFGARTVDRILESCAWVRVGGDNLRFAPSPSEPTP